MSLFVHHTVPENDEDLAGSKLSRRQTMRRSASSAAVISSSTMATARWCLSALESSH